MSIFHKIKQALGDAAYIWWQEMRQIFRDEGIIIFFIVVPLAYPLLYSWIYNNEAVHEVPVVVVDMSHSQLSRQFIRDCNASPDVEVTYYAEDLDEAKLLVSRQLVKGIYYIPSDFATRLNRMEQAVISVYCDMSLMLTYKAIYQTAMTESQRMELLCVRNWLVTIPIRRMLLAFSPWRWTKYPSSTHQVAMEAVSYLQY